MHFAESSMPGSEVITEICYCIAKISVNMYKCASNININLAHVYLTIISTFSKYI